MTNIKKRKNDHVKIVLNNEVEDHVSYFDRYSLFYKSLPEINFEEIEISTKYFDFNFSFPFYISSMTGGSKYAKIINTNIAKACEQEKIPFGLGSMRILHENKDALSSFKVKKFCPNVPMFANLGLVQFNYGIKISDIQRLIDMVSADGLFIHINPLQEAIQPEGNVNYKNLLKKLEQLIKKIKTPLIVKEVGHGIDFETAKKLRSIGIKWIDVSGVGGTSWALIEGYRRLKKNEKMNPQNLGYLFKSEGISTPTALENLNSLKDINLIAGGGIRNGLHIAKSIALGAKLATAARPFLKAAISSDQDVIKIIKRLKKELKIAMFYSGCKNINSLSKIKIK